MRLLSLAIVSTCMVAGCGEDSDSTLSNEPLTRSGLQEGSSGGEVENPQLETVSPTEESGDLLCLDNCSESKSQSITWRSIPFFKGPTSSCKLAESWAFRSRQNNSMSVLFRANYSSAGLWQLYLRKIQADESGNWTPDQAATNIFPECLGTVDGVQDVWITGVEQVGRKAFVVPVGDFGEQVALVRVRAKCASGITLEEKTLDLASGMVVSTPVAPVADGGQYVAELQATELHLSRTGKAYNNSGQEISHNLGTLATKVTRILGQDNDGGTYVQLPSEYSLLPGNTYAEYCDPLSSDFRSYYCKVESNIQYLPLSGSPIRLRETPPQADGLGFFVHPSEGLVWANSQNVVRWFKGHLLSTSSDNFEGYNPDSISKIAGSVIQFFATYSSVSVSKVNLRAGVREPMTTVSGYRLTFSGWLSDQIVLVTTGTQNSTLHAGNVLISSQIRP